MKTYLRSKKLIGRALLISLSFGMLICAKTNPVSANMGIHGPKMDGYCYRCGLFIAKIECFTDGTYYIRQHKLKDGQICEYKEYQAKYRRTCPKCGLDEVSTTTHPCEEYEHDEPNYYGNYFSVDICPIK